MLVLNAINKTRFVGLFGACKRSGARTSFTKLGLCADYDGTKDVARDYD